MVLTAALVASGNLGVPLYASVLLVLGVNRFFLSSLSAALPHVVAEDKLVMANSVSPTAGGIMASVGGLRRPGRARGHRRWRRRGSADHPAGRAAAATWPPAWSPGPCAATCSARTRAERAARPVLGELAIVAAGLVAGARYVLRRRGPAAALGATGGNRLPVRDPVR